MSKKNVALVTGGTRGIGKEISISLSKAGYHVVAAYIGSDDRAKQFSELHGIQVEKWDVSNFDLCQKNTAAIEEKIGPVEVLVNNAGIVRDSMLHKMTDKQWLEVIQTNLNSCFNMSKSVIVGMRERQHGRIINISSINGLAGQIGQTNYAASKAGIIGFTKALALENASKGVTVNAIAPGYIKTDMTSGMKEEVLNAIASKIPVGRMGHPEEIAHAVMFLVSKESSFITGITLNVNGGQYLQ